MKKPKPAKGEVQVRIKGEVVKAILASKAANGRTVPGEVKFALESHYGKGKQT